MDVRLPDGRIVTNVPDGTTQAELSARLASSGIKLDAAPQVDTESPRYFAPSAATEGLNKDYQASTEQNNARIRGGAAPGPSNALGFMEGGSQPVKNVLRTADAVLGGTGVGQRLKEHDAYIARLARAGITPGGAGKFAGQMAATIPITMATGNPWLGGALTGAALTEAKDPLSAGLDVGLSAVGGKVADSAIRGLTGSGAVRNVSQSVRNLIDERVNLTPGQMAGGTLKRLEDAATSVPGVGDLIKGAQQRSLQTFNRAAVNRALEPIGKALPANVEGKEAVRLAGDTLSEAYDNLLPKMTVKMDQRFGAAIRQIGAGSRFLKADETKILQDVIDKDVLAQFQRGTLDGQGLKNVEATLREHIGRVGRSTDPSNQALKDSLQNLQNALRAQAMRNNPALAKELGAINRGYANLVRVERAAGSTGGNSPGIFTPGQLQNAVKATDRSVRQRAVGRGTALMGDLADAGKETLPSSVPDSGTPYRLFANWALTGGAPLAAGYGAQQGWIDPKTAAAIALISAPYSRWGNAAARFGLTGARNQTARQFADLLARFASPAAIAAGGAAAPSLFPPSQ